MSGILRFRIQVDPLPEAGPLQGWQVSISLPQKGNLPVGQPRRLRRLESTKVVDFPMPPEAEPLPALIQDEAGEPTPDELEKVFTAVNGRRVEAAEMRQYGRYLFDTLIGPNWQAILKAAAAEAILPKDAAEAAPGEDILIELALRWAIDDHALHRLHWEAMHNGQRFLIALSYDTSQADIANGNPEEPLVPVTITRLVPSAAPEPKPVTAPVRMLFALGASLTDPQVRPAAEFVGLLHQLKLKNVQYHTRTRLVENISPSMLSQAASEFKPHVLHLISHGNVDREGRPYLELAVDDDENEKERKPAYGSDLVKRLGTNKPVAAVLSACYTSGLGNKVGEMMSGAATAPMAAQLVAGGIPIVVGMSGQVADKACRLFSRGFAGALMSGTPLLMATVIGRLAAFMEDSPSQSWVDWAFPAVFLGDNVAVDFTLLDKEKKGPFSQLDEWANRLNLSMVPVFCGRQDIMLEFYDMLNPQLQITTRSINRTPLLWVKAETWDSGLGRQRLLSEMALDAMRSGHIPLLVGEDDPTWKPPDNPLELAKQLHANIGFLRSEVFGLGFNFWERPRLNQVGLLYDKRNNPVEIFNDKDIDSQVKERSSSHDGTEIPSRAILAALHIEIDELLLDLMKKYPQVFTEESKVVVLLNRVEDYGKALDALLVEKRRWLNKEYGLGDPETKKDIPVVMVYTPKGNTQEVNASDAGRSGIEEMVMQLTMRTRPLKPFEEETDEHLLAFLRVLLHPFKDSLPKPLIENPLASLDARGLASDTVATILKGLPGMYTDATFDAITKSFCKRNILIPAEDEDLIKNIREEQKKQSEAFRTKALQAQIQAGEV